MTLRKMILMRHDFMRHGSSPDRWRYTNIRWGSTPRFAAELFPDYQLRAIAMCTLPASELSIRGSTIAMHISHDRFPVVLEAKLYRHRLILPLSQHLLHPPTLRQ